MKMVVLVLGITFQAFSKWLRKQLSPEESTAKVGRPEAIKPEVVQAFREQYVAKYKTWGPRVLREWGIRKDLGAYAADTIAKAIKPLVEKPPKKPKPQRYEITRPDVMWSEDGTGFKQQGRKQELLVLQDECSRFKLNRRLVDGPADSDDVYAYLKEAFEKYGAPLVLKRDGQSIFLREERPEAARQIRRRVACGSGLLPQIQRQKRTVHARCQNFRAGHGPARTRRHLAHTKNRCRPP
jgi:hypothetical protein